MGWLRNRSGHEYGNEVKPLTNILHEELWIEGFCTLDHILMAPASILSCRLGTDKIGEKISWEQLWFSLHQKIYLSTNTYLILKLGILIWLETRCLKNTTDISFPLLDCLIACFLIAYSDLQLIPGCQFVRVNNEVSRACQVTSPLAPFHSQLILGS